MKKTCYHPVRVGGKCLDCGASINDTERPNKAAEPLTGETPAAAQETPATGQETQKKATRKRKA